MRWPLWLPKPRALEEFQREAYRGENQDEPRGLSWEFRERNTLEFTDRIPDKRELCRKKPRDLQMIPHKYSAKYWSVCACEQNYTKLVGKTSENKRKLIIHRALGRLMRKI